MEENIRIPKRITTALINSLTAGVVPRIGLEHIAVGRKEEVEAILYDLENIREGASTFRFIVGKYGSGKSFMLQIIRNYAMDKGYVVADVDLTPEKRLTGTNNQGLATYRELLQRISVKVRPDGGALEPIMQKWITDIYKMVMDDGKMPEDADYDVHVRKKIYEVISMINGFSHGFDFANVLETYYQGYAKGDEGKKQAALRWIRGEYATKSEAKKQLNVGEIITDENWYSYVKLIAMFVSSVGYEGMLLFIDECVNLYKIINKVSRENNYEKILSMFNDIMQGKASYLGVILGATPELIEDEKRGLFSYEALRSRLKDNRYATDDNIDLTSPLIRLKPLTDEEIVILLERLTSIHEQHFQYESKIVTENIVKFMQVTVNRLGANILLTPREITRDYLGLLNTLHQSPNKKFDDLVKEEQKTKAIENNKQEDMFADFLV